MHLGKSKSKNSVSLYVLKSTCEYGFHSTKIVENLRMVDELSRKLNGEDPIEWAKKYIATEKKKKNRKKYPQPIPQRREYPEMIIAHSMAVISFSIL